MGLHEQRAGSVLWDILKEERLYQRICSLSQQVILSPSLFNPEDFMPLDPTQEPIFPPELLVGDAPGKGPTKTLCH